MVGRKRSILVFILGLALAGCGGGGGGGGDPAPTGATWIRQAGGVDADLCEDVATFTDGSTVVTGYFLGTTVFAAGSTQETTLASAGGLDLFVARYRPNGDLSWAVRDGDVRDDRGQAVDTFSDGACVVTGFTINPIAGDLDAYVSRYTPSGQRSWIQYGYGSGFDEGSGVAAYGDGSCVFGGRFTDVASFGEGQSNQTILSSSGGQHGFVARYASDGALEWAVAIGGTGRSNVSGVAPGPGGAAVVTGSFDGTVVLGPGEPGARTLVSAGLDDAFVARYRADGTLEWAEREGTTGNEIATDVATYADGSFVVCGETWVGRYAAGGQQLWTRSLSPPVAGGVRGRVAALPDGSSLFGSEFTGTVTLGAGEPTEATLTSAGQSDLFFSRHAADGALLWTRAIRGPGYSGGAFVASHADGTIAVAGYFSLGVTFAEGETGETSRTSAGTSDVFTARFGADGRP